MYRHYGRQERLASHFEVYARGSGGRKSLAADFTQMSADQHGIYADLRDRREFGNCIIWQTRN
jgi:hypothetical protein